MSPAEISHAIQEARFFTALRESALVYPIILSLHLTAISLFGGLILMTDLRLLGLSLKSASISDIVKQTRVWKRIGFLIMVTCGILLACAKLDDYYDNPYFLIKMSFLLLVGVHAIVFRKSVYGNTEQLDQMPSVPGVAKLAACLSLVLWIGILSMGRFIANFEKPRSASITSPIVRQVQRSAAPATPARR